MEINDKNFFYQDAAEPIVDSILSLMSQGIKDFESYDHWPYDISISDAEDDHRHFNWSFSVCRARDEFVNDLVYDIVGSAGKDCFDEPSIAIAIVIPSGKHQKKINVNRNELFDVVSHELHHIAQNIDSNVYQKNTIETGRLSYFLDPFEIEAFHIGTRAQARLTGESFFDIANKYLQKAWPEGTSNEIERVIKAWQATDFPAFNQNLKNSKNIV